MKKITKTNPSQLTTSPSKEVSEYFRQLNAKRKIKAGGFKDPKNRGIGFKDPELLKRAMQAKDRVRRPRHEKADNIDTQEKS